MKDPASVIPLNELPDTSQQENFTIENLEILTPQIYIDTTFKNIS
jgi:hypothetical protein